MNTIYKADQIKEVYLSGPIKGMSYKNVIEWRKEVNNALYNSNINTLSPLRGLLDINNESNLQDILNKLDSNLLHYINDYNDVKRADAILVNLIGTDEISITTIMEIVWAKNMQKPVIIIIEDKGNPHDHEMLMYNIIRCNSLDLGIKHIKRTLSFGI